MRECCRKWCGVEGGGGAQHIEVFCERSKWASEKTANRSENGIFEKQTTTTTTAAEAAAVAMAVLE